MLAEFTDDIIKAIISHRETEIDNTLAYLGAVTGKDVDSLTMDEIKAVLLASTVSVVNTVNQMAKKIDVLTDSIGDQVKTVNNQADECKERFATKEDIRHIAGNLTFRAGKFISNKSRLVSVIFIIAMVLANARFVSNYRHLILYALGLTSTILQAT